MPGLGWGPSPASSQQPQPGYELQIMPPSGGDWPVMADRPDTGLERGQQTEGAAIRTIMQYNHTPAPARRHERQERQEAEQTQRN